MEKKHSPLSEGGLGFTLAAVLPVLLSFLVVSAFRAALGNGYTENIYYRYLVFFLPQLAFAAVELVFFRRSKLSPREFFAPAKPRYFLYAFALSFGLLVAFNGLNDLFIELLKLMGYVPRAEQPGYVPPVSADMVQGFMIVPSMLIIALLPALCEETLFRGMQVRVMQKSGWGEFSAAFLSGALFALFHGNPEQTIYQFLCGAVYGLLAFRARSVLPGMLAHFANNAAILILSALFGVDFVFPMAWAIALGVIGGVMFAAAVFLLIWEGRGEKKGGMPAKGSFFLPACVGIVILAVEWLAMLLQGFLL